MATDPLAATCFDAWRVPFWGSPAETVAPPWLIRALQTGRLFINHLGGLSTATLMEETACYPGAFVVLRADNTIEFREVMDTTDAERPSA